MYCGECLSKGPEIVELVNGVCPKCGTDYAATADAFNVPMSADDWMKKGGYKTAKKAKRQGGR